MNGSRCVDLHPRWNVASDRSSSNKTKSERGRGRMQQQQTAKFKHRYRLKLLKVASQRQGRQVCAQPKSNHLLVPASARIGKVGRFTRNERPSTAAMGLAMDSTLFVLSLRRSRSSSTHPSPCLASAAKVRECITAV